MVAPAGRIDDSVPPDASDKTINELRPRAPPRARHRPFDAVEPDPS
jgi:hypothetical protein